YVDDEHDSDEVCAEKRVKHLKHSEDSFGSLQKFRRPNFYEYIDGSEILSKREELLETPVVSEDNKIPIFSFYLCIDAHRVDDETVSTSYRFENSRHEEIQLQDPLPYLITLKTVKPFLRIRAASLALPIQNNGSAREKVDSVLRQAYLELTENGQAYYSKDCGSAPDPAKGQVLAKTFIESNRDELEQSLVRLDKVLAHKAADDFSDIVDASAQYAELMETNKTEGGKHNSEPDNINLAVVKGRVAAPLSTLSFNADAADTATDERDYNRFNALLRGTGARSMAMLAFADAFFRVQAEGNDDIVDYSPLLSIEDPEVFLHPLMLTSVWNLIERMTPQRIICTNNPDLLLAVPLTSTRRIVRAPEGLARVFSVRPGHMQLNDLRRIAYHLRVRRGTALFMRFWLLVEGETEYWLLPEIAKFMGYDLRSEGIEFVEFAQCGLKPLVELANELGISWHLLCDGDKAGDTYAKQAAPYARKLGLGQVTKLKEDDVESCFWENGFEEVFRDIAGPAPAGNNKKAEKAKDVIKRAVRTASKPGLALALGQAVQEPGAPSIPRQISNLICDAVRRARSKKDWLLIESED
ncbi:DUF2813 domain-containing protein, partial [bacterium]|nr:DUF2813 domain-containing protein [bacterium]